MIEICTPAIVYSVIVSTQIIIDVMKGFYEYALIKFLIMVIITILINMLCKRELTSLAWVIVLVPYIYTAFMSLLLLYLFGRLLIPNSISNTTTSIKTDVNNTNNSSVPYTSVIKYPSLMIDDEYVSNYTFW